MAFRFLIPSQRRPIVIFLGHLCLSLVRMGDFSMAQDQDTIVDFRSKPQEYRWRIVNDGVMGGLSRSQWTITSNQTAVFEGTLSLENNGGFASVRTEPSSFGLAGRKGLILRVRGDGRSYQLRLRTDRQWDGISYRSIFNTREDKWVDVKLDFEGFSPTFRGRRVPDAPALDPNRIQQIGFLISDKQEGPFRLEIQSIKVY